MSQTDEELERELRKGLRLRDAPEGFAERVIALAATQHARRGLPRAPTGIAAPLVKGPVIRWAIAASLLASFAAGGTWSHHERMQREAGERAREQVLLAFRITSATLQSVHDRITEDEH